MKRSARVAVLAAVITAFPFAAAGPASAAVGPYLVRDIALSGGSQPAELTAVGNVLFFTAKGRGGLELWKSDGTSSGTMRVKDIRPGWRGSNPQRLRNVAGIVYFTANDGTHGYELWRSDGTATGTWMVKDITPGPESSIPTSFSDIYGTIYFFRNSPSNELWKSNGTPSGTQRVKVLDPLGTHNSPDEIFAFDGRAWFVGSFNDDFSAEQWVSDGTPEGTELWAGDPTLWGPPVKVGSNWFFTGLDESTGRELYRSTDGTLGAIELVEDIWPGSEWSRPLDLVSGGGGRLFFTANDGIHSRQLWRSDGTPEGTRRLTDLEDLTVPELTRFRSGVVFLNHGEAGLLWKSNGTRRGTRNVAIEADGVGSMTAVGDTLVFSGTVLDFGLVSAVPPHDTELWRTDGTSAGTEMVFDINPMDSSNPRDLIKVGNAVYFTAVDGEHGRELWRYVP